jgi:hypothetical protein
MAAVVALLLMLGFCALVIESFVPADNSDPFVAATKSEGCVGAKLVAQDCPCFDCRCPLLLFTSLGNESCAHQAVLQQRDGDPTLRPA